MLRIIVATTDAERAAHVGGPVEVSYKSFDIEAPQVEAFLSAGKKNQFWSRTLVGVEVITETAQ